MLIISSANKIESAFDSQRDSHAATDAQSGETLLCVTLLHFMEQGDKHTRA